MSANRRGQGAKPTSNTGSDNNDREVLRAIERLRTDVNDLRAVVEAGLRELAKASVTEQSQQRHMTAEQCATYIGRTVKAVYSMVKRGQIPHSRPGGRLQFDRQRIDRWMERHTHRRRRSAKFTEEAAE